MARKPRIHVPGGLYHVMLRGNGGQAIFFSDADRYRLFLLVQDGVERFGHRIHAFCLMKNHIHLVVQAGDIPLSRIMQNLSFRYTRWVNSRHKRTGHLFQGRYKALLVDKDSYLLELVRYVHLNPVRAGMVTDPDVYQWSGHRAYLGEEHLTWLTCDAVLAQFGDSIDMARAKYARFVMEGINETYRADFHQGGDDSRLLGEDRFLQQVMAQTDTDVAIKLSLDDLLASVAGAFEIDIAELCGPGRKRSIAKARGVAAWLVSETDQLTLAELARCMQRDPSALSLLAKKARERAATDLLFQSEINAIKSALIQNNSITHT